MDAASNISTAIMTPVMAGISELIVCASDFDCIEHLIAWSRNTSGLWLFESDTSLYHMSIITIISICNSDTPVFSTITK